MPIMLATYSTNKIIVLTRYVIERRKNINQTNTLTQTKYETKLPLQVHARIHSLTSLRFYWVLNKSCKQ